MRHCRSLQAQVEQGVAQQTHDARHSRSLQAQTSCLRVEIVHQAEKGVETAALIRLVVAEQPRTEGERIVAHLFRNRHSIGVWKLVPDRLDCAHALFAPAFDFGLELQGGIVRVDLTQLVQGLIAG